MKKSKGKKTKKSGSELWGLKGNPHDSIRVEPPPPSLRSPSRNNLPNSIPEPSIAGKQVDRAAVDRLLEQAGFTSVDELDAEHYRLIREANVRTLRKLLHRLKKEKLSAPSLASIIQKLGQGEKDKLGAIHLKIGRPSDRPR